MQKMLNNPSLKFEMKFYNLNNTKQEEEQMKEVQE